MLGKHRPWAMGNWEEEGERGVVAIVAKAGIPVSLTKTRERDGSIKRRNATTQFALSQCVATTCLANNSH